MGYHLDAFIQPLTNWWPPHLPVYPAVVLAGEPALVMIPLVVEVLDAITGDDHEAVLGTWDLTESLRCFGVELSAGGPVAYVNGEGSAGGTQTSVVWRDGAIVLGPLLTADNDADTNDELDVVRAHDVRDGVINQALRYLGVRVTHFDEFASVGLDRYRATEDWLHGER